MINLAPHAISSPALSTSSKSSNATADTSVDSNILVDATTATKLSQVNLSAATKSNSLNSQENSKQPWVVLVNAPADSIAHQALISLLPVSGHPISSVILMGAGAQAAAAGGKLGDLYAILAKKLGCELLVCGLAAKNYGLIEDKLHTAFTLTGFMEILSLIHNAAKFDNPESFFPIEHLDNSESDNSEFSNSTDPSDHTKSQRITQPLGYRVINW